MISRFSFSDFAGVAIVIIVITLAYSAWSRENTEKKEWALLLAGDQLRQAIGEYYEQSPGGVKQFPAALQDLLRDGRGGVSRSHLPQLPSDPLTASADWGLIKEGDHIVGVYSKADGEPLVKDGLPGAYRRFAGKQRYADWKFIYSPNSIFSASVGSVAPAQSAAVPMQEDPAAVAARSTVFNAKTAQQTLPVMDEQQEKGAHCAEVVANAARFCAIIGQRKGASAESSCTAYVEARKAACIEGRPMPTADSRQWQ